MSTALERETAIRDIEQAASAALEALTVLRDSITRAHRVMPGRHIASYTGLTHSTVTRWRVEIPPMRLLRVSLRHIDAQAQQPPL